MPNRRAEEARGEMVCVSTWTVEELFLLSVDWRPGSLEVLSRAARWGEEMRPRDCHSVASMRKWARNSNLKKEKEERRKRKEK